MASPVQEWQACSIERTTRYGWKAFKYLNLSTQNTTERAWYLVCPDKKGYCLLT